jgi:ABC-type transport system involved in cytochrome bd biosynthesis fused ATPase/permease subunit
MASSHKQSTCEEEAPLVFIATSQQSRFYTSDTSHAVKLLDVHDIHMSVGHKELLAGADLQFSAGKHYRLVGRIGTGKSLLFQAIAR